MSTSIIEAFEDFEPGVTTKDIRQEAALVHGSKGPYSLRANSYITFAQNINGKVKRKKLTSFEGEQEMSKIHSTLEFKYGYIQLSWP